MKLLKENGAPTIENYFSEANLKMFVNVVDITKIYNAFRNDNNKLMRFI